MKMATTNTLFSKLYIIEAQGDFPSKETVNNGDFSQTNHICHSDRWFILSCQINIGLKGLLKIQSFIAHQSWASEFTTWNLFQVIQPDMNLKMY